MDKAKDTLARSIAIVGLICSVVSLGAELYKTVTEHTRERQAQEHRVAELKIRIADELSAVSIVPRGTVVGIHPPPNDPARIHNAEEFVTEALRLANTDPELLNHKTFLLCVRGRLQEALRNAQMNVDINPQSTVAHVGLAGTLLQLGQTDDARSELRSYERSATAVEMMGLLEWSVGDRASAISYLHRAIELDPDRGDYYVNLAATLQAEHHVDEAIRVLRTGHRKAAPPYPIMYVNLSSLLVEMQDYLGALAPAKLAVDRMPNLAGAHNNLAVVYMKLNKLDEAEEQLQAASFLDPDDDNIKANIKLLREGRAPLTPHKR